MFKVAKPSRAVKKPRREGGDDATTLSALSPLAPSIWVGLLEF